MSAPNNGYAQPVYAAPAQGGTNAVRPHFTSSLAPFLPLWPPFLCLFPFSFTSAPPLISLYSTLLNS